MLFIVIVVMGVSFIMVRTLNASTWKADRLRVTNAALGQAKEALIARAVADANRPGSLPCPDADGDGDAELFSGNDCPKYIGRLPWQTLGLPDLRDAEGERLWYVLSPSHRDHPTAQPINSDTAGMINVVGGAPATDVVAVVIAPGRALTRAGAAGSQRRDCPANCNNPVNYLDVAGGVDNAVWAPVAGVATLSSAAESNSFNDRVVPITRDEIMRLVERRAGRELGGKLRAHFDAWESAPLVNNTKGFYPWAAPFTDPSIASPGTNGTQTGQLPMSAANVVWSNANMALGNCTGEGTSQLQCSGPVLCVAICLTPITARLNGIGTAFIDPPNGSEVTTSFVGVTVLGVIPGGTWTLNAAQQRLDFAWNGVALIGVGTVQVTIKAPAQSAWVTSPTDWLVANNWPSLSHYSVSQRYAISGTNACGGGGPGTCITVGNATNKEAVVTMTGKALPLASPSQTRATPALDQFLEGGNQDPTDLVLERNLRTLTFNDQPIAVRPWP
jgi:hypothetical protein